MGVLCWLDLFHLGRKAKRSNVTHAGCSITNVRSQNEDTHPDRVTWLSFYVITVTDVQGA